MLLVGEVIVPDLLDDEQQREQESQDVEEDAREVARQMVLEVVVVLLLVLVRRKHEQHAPDRHVKQRLREGGTNVLSLNVNLPSFAYCGKKRYRT